MSASNSFANPVVDESVVNAVVDYLESVEKAYSWDVVCHVACEEGVSKETARKGLRKLRMQNKVVPAEPFVGELEVAG